jgi:hypothetical protein
MAVVRRQWHHTHRLGWGRFALLQAFGLTVPFLSGAKLLNGAVAEPRGGMPRWLLLGKFDRLPLRCKHPSASLVSNRNSSCGRLHHIPLARSLRSSFSLVEARLKSVTWPRVLPTPLLCSLPTLR